MNEETNKIDGLSTELRETLESFNNAKLSTPPKVLEKRIYPEAKNKMIALVLIGILVLLIYFVITQ